MVFNELMQVLSDYKDRGKLTNRLTGILVVSHRKLTTYIRPDNLPRQEKCRPYLLSVSVLTITVVFSVFNFLANGRCLIQF